MEKLIELLNEYEFKVADTFNYAERECTEEDVYRLSDRIISKKYGFIRWLVENNKIDLLQLDNRIALSEFNKVERVLMALSISSSPIEDLISYLHE